MSVPLVSIMMPARNEERFIREAIQSVLDQTFENWELIIVDDRSTDATREIALEFARNDKRIRVLDGDGICSGNARNKAIEVATGDYIMNMDADDVAAPTRIEKLVSVAKQHSNVVVGSFMAVVDLDLKVKRISEMPLDNEAIRKKLSRRWGREAILPQTMMISATLLKRYRYNEFYRVMVDWDLILRLAEDDDVVFINVPELLYRYRLNDGSMSLKQTARVRYNLLLRYNEIQRQRGRPEIRSLDAFEAMVRQSLLNRMLYRSVFLLKRAQHSIFWLRYQFSNLF